mgnify:CR=1 FL=1
MKKLLFIIGFLLSIVLITIIGSIILTGSIEVKNNEDVFITQENLEKDFTSYGYTLDNPNVIINPYEISPLTALVIFETKDKVSVTVIIKGKEQEDYTYTLNDATVHYIPIYYLYEDYDNEVIIKAGSDIKSINIKTSPHDIDIDNYPNYYDNYGNLRWYLTKKYQGKMTHINNNHYLFGSEELNEDNKSISVVEIDLLGKIYLEYLLEDGYYGLSTQTEENILVLSDNLLEIDHQTGTIISEYSIDFEIDYLTFRDNQIIFQNENNAQAIDYKTKEIKDINRVTEEEISLNISDFKLSKPVRFGVLKETKLSNKKISLLNYSSYKDNLDIIKEYNRLVIKPDSNEETYVILDQFLDKRVYKIEGNVLYINDTNLKGKYTIYIKIGKKLYKTDYFVKY